MRAHDPALSAASGARAAGPPPPRRLRSVGAVIAGFFATAVLSVATDAVMHALHVFPPLGRGMAPPLFALATAYRTLFTIVGGYVTAALAPAQPMRHASVLAAIGVLAATLGLVVSWSHIPEIGPAWYPIALVVLAAPSVWVGAKLRTR
jgi:hypothetical protein